MGRDGLALGNGPPVALAADELPPVMLAPVGLAAVEQPAPAIVLADVSSQKAAPTGRG